MEEEALYSWEEKYKRSWDVLQEDGSGSLAGVISTLEAQLLKKKRIVQDSLQVKRGIIRYIYIVIDRSIAMAEIDLKPTRIEVVCQILTALVREFFDENPLSQIGILFTMDGLAYKLCELSSNPSEIIHALSRKEFRTTSGVPSLMNVLEFGCNSLRYVIDI
jgi:transcription initiation factor TFIIH subunit 2